MTPSKARRQGREMYYPGEDPAMLNPYRANHHHHQDFLDGWNEAKLKQESAAREAEMLNRTQINGTALLAHLQTLLVYAMEEKTRTFEANLRNLTLVNMGKVAALREVIGLVERALFIAGDGEEVES